MMNTQLFTAIINALNNLDDVQGAQVLSIVSGLTNMSQPVSAAPVQTKSELHIEEEGSKREPLQIEGTAVWTEDFCKVTRVGRQYRLYITCPVQGEKGEKIRYAIKAGAKKDYGCKWAGEFGTGKIFWAFPDKKTADKYIADRKARVKEA